MNKKGLIKLAATKCGMNKTETTKVFSAIIEIMSDTLAKEESIVLQGFGSFTIKERKARNGVNPSTKEPMILPAIKVVRFKASKKN